MTEETVGKIILAVLFIWCGGQVIIGLGYNFYKWWTDPRNYEFDDEESQWKTISLKKVWTFLVR
jgi:hypothetical protein